MPFRSLLARHCTERKSMSLFCCSYVDYELLMAIAKENKGKRRNAACIGQSVQR